MAITSPSAWSRHAAGLWVPSTVVLGAFDAIGNHLLEGQAGRHVHGVATSERLPAADREIDIGWVNLQPATLPPHPLCRQQRCARAAESVENDLAATGAILDGVGDHAHRLHRRMAAQVFQTTLPEGVGAGVLPHVRPVAAMAPQLDRVQVGR